MANLFDIKDKVVVITGGTGILGHAISFYLAEQGAKVVIMGRKTDVGNAMVADIKEKGGEAMYLTTDVMNRELLEQNLVDIMTAYGRVDALLNAAGGNMPGATIAPDKTFFDLNPDDFQKVLNLNLMGTVLPTQVFLQQMAKQGKGAIVNFSSMSAFRPLTRVAGYGVAKAGVSNFTAYMATEVAKKFSTAIRVNAIAPGIVDTDMANSMSEAEQKEVVEKIVMQRKATPEEIAKTIYFLASEDASYITGQIIRIDGGM